MVGGGELVIVLLAIFGLPFIIIGLFIIFRKFTLWYWKIDRIVELLEKIEAKIPKQ
ncbi:MAG: hypothetical protein WC071_02245 [Victivallaceae bacterium]